jgi:ribonuclease HII
VRTVIKGDQTILSVAAASVVAKVTRDAMMAEEAEHYPPYGFESNRGYPAPVHKAALAAYGPSAIHRRSWIFMEYCLWGGLPRYEREPRLF